MTRRMYGDLLNGAMFSISLPMLLVCAFSNTKSSAWSSVRPIEEYSHHSASTARYLHEQSFLSLPLAKHAPVAICSLFLVTLLNNARAFWYTDRLASCLAYLTLHCISICLILYEWPNPGDENIWTHVFWHFLIATTNLQQPFLAKTALGIFSALQKMLIVYLSPRYTLEETVPTIIGATALYLVLNFGLSRIFDTNVSTNNNTASTKREGISWRTVRKTAVYFVLFILFAYFSAVEVANIIQEPGYIVTGSRKVITACFFGVVGLIVGGAFRDGMFTANRVSGNEDDLAEQANAQAQAATSAMLLTTQALNASQTAVAITDLERRVLMINPSFELLTGHAPGTVTRHSLLEDVLQQAGDDAIRVMTCYLIDSSGEDDFIIANRQIRVKVAPSSLLSETEPIDAESDEDAMIMVVVLRDMTHERALEQAVETAHQHALRTRAIMVAIEALTRQMQAQQPPPQPAFPAMMMMMQPPQQQQQFAVIDVIPDNQDDEDFEIG